MMQWYHAEVRTNVLPMYYVFCTRDNLMWYEWDLEKMKLLISPHPSMRFINYTVFWSSVVAFCTLFAAVVTWLYSGTDNLLHFCVLWCLVLLNFNDSTFFLFSFLLIMLSWMQKPRCGVPDRFKSASRSRKRRYALTGQKWQRTHITYRWEVVEAVVMVTIDYGST